MESGLRNKRSVLAFLLSLAAAGAGFAQTTEAPPVQHVPTAKVQAEIDAGHRCRERNELALAVDYYGYAIKLDPMAAEAYLGRAWTFLKMGGKADYDKALSDAAKVIELEPGNRSAHFVRGKAYLHKARSAKEAKNLKEAGEFFDKALAAYEVARAGGPGSIELLVDIGHAYFGKGDLDRALAAFSSAYEKDPPYSLNVDWALKELFYECGRQKRAIEFGNAPRTLHLAGCYWTKGNPDLAIRCFSRSLELGLEPWKVYLDRSKAFAEKGDFANAIADADSVLKVYQWSSVYVNRAEIYEKKRDFDKAIGDYTAAIKATRKDMKRADSQDALTMEAEGLIRLYMKRAELYTWSRSWDKVIADYLAVDKMTLLGPAKASLYKLIALAYQDKGDKKNAGKYLRKAQAVETEAKK